MTKSLPKPGHFFFGYFLVGLLLVVVSIYELNGWSGFYISLIPGTDMEVYLENAHGLLAGSWPPSEPFYRAPLYPYFLAPLLLICRSLMAIAVAQGVLYICGLVLIVLTVAIELGMVAAAGAGILILGYGGGMYLVSVAHSAILELFLAALFLFALAVWRRSVLLVQGQPPAIPTNLPLSPRVIPWLRFTTFWSILTGMSFALLCLVRPNFLILIPFYAIGFWRDGQTWKIARHVQLKHLGAMALIVGFILGLVVVRNNRHADRLVGLSTNGAATYVIANSEDSAVFNFIYPQGRLLHPGELAFWKHQCKKAIGYWWSCEVPQNDNFYLFRENSALLKLLRVPFAGFGALTIIGSVLLWRRMGQFWPYYAFFWPYYLSIVAFFILGRFRLPGLPAMMVIGVGGLTIIGEYWRQKRLRSLALASAGLTGLFLSMQPWASRIRPNDYFNSAYCSLFFQDSTGALVTLDRLANLDGRPLDRDTKIYQVIALTMEGKFSAARDLLTVLIDQFPEDKGLLKSQIVLLKFMGDNQQAEQLRERDFHDFDFNSHRDLIGEGILYFHQEHEKQKKKLWRLLGAIEK